MDTSHVEVDFSYILVLQKGKLSSELNDLDHVSIQPTQKLYK